eukprot:403347778
MFSQNLSFGMMLQSAMELQQKYHQSLPNEFPLIPQKLRTFKELTEYLINQVDFLLNSHNQQQNFIFSIQQLQQQTQHQQYLTNGFDMHQSLLSQFKQQEGNGDQFEEQVTFNENDERSQNLIMGSVDPTEELICRLKSQIIEKDNLIDVLQNQVKKNLGLENLQYKFELQSKRLTDLQTLIRQKDSQIEQLNIRLYQKECSKDDLSPIKLPLNSNKHQNSIRAASTPRPILTSQLTTLNHSQITTPNSRTLLQSQQNFEASQNQQFSQLITSNKYQGSSKLKNYDMPLQSMRNSTNSNLQNILNPSKNHENQINRTSILQSHSESIQDQFNMHQQMNGIYTGSLISQSNNFNGSLVGTDTGNHFILRCQTQAEIIEQLLKEKDSFKIQNSASESQLKEVLKMIYEILNNQNSQLSSDSQQTLVDQIKQAIEQLKQTINNLKQQTKFSSLNDKEDVISTNQFNSIIGDQSIQFINNGKQSPKQKSKNRQNGRSKSNKRHGYNDQEDEKTQNIQKLETQISELKNKINSELYKNQKLQQAFQQIESIFKQEQNSNSHDQDSNDKQILEHIQTLNRKYINELVELKSQNTQLEQLISKLQFQINNAEQQDCSQNFKSISSPSNNQFKRNNAIKKVQGFFQSKFNYNAAQSSVASLVYSESSTCSTNDLMLFKQSQIGSSNQNSQQQLISTSPSELNMPIQGNLIQDTGIIIMNNQLQKTAQDVNIIELKEKIQILQKEKQLLDLEYKQQIDKLLLEISELNIIKDSYDEEKTQNIQLQIDLEKKDLKIKELQEKNTQIQNEIQDVQNEYGKLVKKYDNQVKQMKTMTDAQLELKSLIDDERKAYNEDREKFETDMQHMQQANETKQKLIKTKLIALYDGAMEEAKQLQIDELIENIARRLNLSNKINAQAINNSRRVASVQNRQIPSDQSLDKSPDQYNLFKGGFIENNAKKIVTSHELHRKSSCVKPLKQSNNNYMIINENDSNSREQIYQMLSGNKTNQNTNNCSISKNSFFGGQDQMTKIIELCQVQNNQPGGMNGQSLLSPATPDQNLQADFIQSNISPIKKLSNNENEQLYTQNTFDNGEAQKESRIMPADQYRAFQESRIQAQNQTRIISKGSIKHQSFIKNNMNHQAMPYMQKSSIVDSSRSVIGNKENLIQTERARKPIHLNNYSNIDYPLQMKAIISPQAQHPPSLNILAHRPSVNNPATQSLLPQQITLQNQIVQPTHYNTNDNNSSYRPSSLNRNENLNSIIENFRREKNVFNQKFQELKQKLETFNSPSKTQREPSSSMNQRLFKNQVQNAQNQQNCIQPTKGHQTSRVVNSTVYENTTITGGNEKEDRIFTTMSTQGVSSTITNNYDANKAQQVWTRPSSQNETRELLSSLGQYNSSKPQSALGHHHHQYEASAQHNYERQNIYTAANNQQQQYRQDSLKRQNPQTQQQQSNHNMRYNENYQGTVINKYRNEEIVESALYQNNKADISETTPVKQRTIRTGYE